MSQCRQPVVGDVFDPTDVLTVDVRLRLAGLLGVAGRAPAVLPGQLARCALPVDGEARTAVRDEISAGLDSHAVAALEGRRLDVIVPALAGHDEDDAVAPFLSSQVRRRLEPHLDGTTLGALTVGQIAGWPGIGPRRAALVVVAAVDAGFGLVGSGEAPPVEVGATVDDLTTVLAHDATSGGELRRRLEDLAGEAPPEVRSAAERVLAVPASEPDRCLAFLDGALAAAGDGRDRSVFEHVVLPLGPPVTRAELAPAVGVGPERVRQLGVRAVARVDDALDAAPPALRRLAATVSDRIGAAAPRAALDGLLASLGFPDSTDSRSRLLVRMAGPYRPVDGHPGWVATEPVELVTETRRMIREDGGVRLGEHLAKELHTLGMNTEHVAAWLARQPVRTTDGLVVSTSGTPGDVAERVLHACGRAMAVDELTAWVAGDQDAVEALWTVRDRRFFVTDDDALALAEWGGDETDGSDGSAQRPGRLRSTVDQQVLAGAGGPVPPALAHALGLGHGDRRTFTTRFGPLTLAYDAGQPTRGSLRPVALAVGAVVGDELVITLYPDRREADVELVPSSGPT